MKSSGKILIINIQSVEMYRNSGYDENKQFNMILKVNISPEKEYITNKGKNEDKMKFNWSDSNIEFNYEDENYCHFELFDDDLLLGRADIDLRKVIQIGEVERSQFMLSYKRKTIGILCVGFNYLTFLNEAYMKKSQRFRTSSSSNFNGNSSNKSSVLKDSLKLKYPLNKLNDTMKNSVNDPLMNSNNSKLTKSLNDTNKQNSLTGFDNLQNTVSSTKGVSVSQRINNNSFLYFQHNSTNIYEFSFSNNSFEKLELKKKYFFPIYQRFCELPDNSYLLTGGELNNSTVNLTVLYKKGDFLLKDAMNFCRKAHSIIYHEGFVYVFGGYDQHFLVKTSEKYNIVSGVWSQISDLPFELSYSTTLLINENLIFLIGGIINNAKNYVPTNKIIQYHVSENIFEESSVKLNYECYGCLATLTEEKNILIVGGYNPDRLTQIYTINPMNSEITLIKEPNEIYWSILPMTHFNGSYHFFSTGEELESLPEYFTFEINK